MELQSISQKNPADYLKILFRRKWFLITPIVIGVVCGIIAGNVMQKSYESSSLILVEEGRVINPLIQGLAVSSSLAQRLGVLREQVLGWDRIAQLIKTLNLAKDVKNQSQFESLVKLLRTRIKVNLRGTNIIGISYVSKDPSEAQNIVKTISDILISENMRQQTKETEDAVVFINEQVDLFQKKIKESEVSAMEDQLGKLMVDSTSKHPLVIELKKKIEAAKEEIKNGNFSIETSGATGSNSESKSLKNELRQMREDVINSPAEGSEGGANRSKSATASNDKLYKLLLLEKAEQSSSQDESVNQKMYNTLLERLETAKITQRLEASKEGTRYTILDPARLPLKPKWPNKPLVLLMSIFMSGCVGIGLIFLMELFDHSFLGLDEARAFLDLPIFGAISKIVTENDVKASELKRTRFTGISIAAGVILLIVVIFNVFLGN